ncbi:MOSC domain-containing protein [Herbidospora galbida]|uniref:MOSC domain-containing protein n=1 Tax=Herbidospora galbida TaxID=2575442 RepID=A0A4U3LP02_9ACTN|nr:MOSC N-terminal beta barrel domain-containing protein [Herbidospora galbida]TKK77362.1 MOSC domain-containing protein [Herbidospora galbida]
MKLSDIRIYPVKSVTGIRLDRAQVLPWGLEGDRRWAVVDDKGDGYWSGENPEYLAVRAVNTPEGGLILNAPGLDELRVPPADGPLVPVYFHGLDEAMLAHDDAHEWFTRLLGKPARLVYLDDPNRRHIVDYHGGLPGEVVSFAWDAPLLLVTRDSLTRLDDWIAEGAIERQEEAPRPLDVARFRPSVVVEGFEPFEEDTWTSVRIGDVDFRVSELCDRCFVTLWDPDTRERGKEPLRTLAKHRRWDGKTWFGIRLVPRNLGELAVGDPVVPVVRT